MKPWRDIEVDAYMPLAIMAYKKPFAIAAVKMEEPTMALDEEEIECLRSPLKEALQRGIYDLKLGSLAGNPYLALALASATIAGVKWGAVQARRIMDQEEEKRKAALHGHLPLSPDQLQQPPSPSPRRTRRDSSTTSTRTPESGGEFLSVDSPEVANRFSFDNGSGEDDA